MKWVSKDFEWDRLDVLRIFVLFFVSLLFFLKLKFFIFSFFYFIRLLGRLNVDVGI